ncbi:MAG: hypothetical protein QOH58_1089 [Thermoleophilaceae bacterium]|jgi:hypothetical protein|nr:hypothetical protein [Thermoleophilaceae bacterium]
MRKLWIAVAAAAVAALAVAGIASAVNTYEVHIASGSPTKPKGSLTAPVPSKLNFGYRVGDSDNLRPSVVTRYFIAAEGLKSFPKSRPTCTFTQATQSPAYARACRAAIVGSGRIDNEAGAPNDRAQKLPCSVDLTLINISNGPGVTKKRGGMAIRIDTEDDTDRCPIQIHDALAAPFFDVKIEGIPTSELRFTVPDSLAHPSGLDNAVRVVVSTVNKVTGKVKIKGQNRTVGYYSAVGRKGAKRTVRVTFVAETGQRSTATTTYPK